MITSNDGLRLETSVLRWQAAEKRLWIDAPVRLSRGGAVGRGQRRSTCGRPTSATTLAGRVRTTFTGRQRSDGAGGPARGALLVALMPRTRGRPSSRSPDGNARRDEAGRNDKRRSRRHRGRRPDGALRQGEPRHLHAATWWPDRTTRCSTPIGSRSTWTRRVTGSSARSRPGTCASSRRTAAPARRSAPSTSTSSSGWCSSATRGSGRTTTSCAATRSRSSSPRIAPSWRAASRSGSRPSSTRRTTEKQTAEAAPRADRRRSLHELIDGRPGRAGTRRSGSRAARSSTPSSLDIQRGEVVGLLGPNGAGKTTSFYMMVGLLPADGGRIFLEGQEITALPMYQRCRNGHRLSAAGVVGIPEADRRGEPARDPRDARPLGRRAPRARPRAPGGARPHVARALSGLHALGRRAPPARDHARTRHVARSTSCWTSRSRASIPSRSATSRRSSRGCENGGSAF